MQRSLNRTINPEINSAEFTPEEDLLLIKLHEQFGNNWTKIKEYFKKRTNIQ